MDKKLTIHQKKILREIKKLKKLTIEVAIGFGKHIKEL